MPSSDRHLLDTAIELVADDMKRVDRIIQQQLASDIVLINSLAAHLIHSGGKRLRPLILLLCAKALNNKNDHHALLAAVIEFIHTATLLHDDVVDESDLRRGQPTANELWGNEASVLVGDYLYSRAFQMMVQTQRLEVMDVLADTTNAIAEGEVMQLLNVNSPEISESDYFDTIYRKTAKLFESAAELGAIIADATAAERECCRQYGKHLGNAFQLMDDLMDYTSSSETMGKNCGDDLAEGKPTLPLIIAMQRANAADKQLIEHAITEASDEHFDEILKILHDTDALTYVKDQAKLATQNAMDALAPLKDNAGKQALMNLAQFAGDREY